MSTETSEAKQALMRQLTGKTGRHFWRSLEELWQTPDGRRFMASEFPALARNGISINRRSLLKIMGGSLALAGLSACKSDKDEAAYPYVSTPENVTIGEAKWYATAVTFDGYAQPVLGKTFTGRPVKLEGNPDHPMSRGTTDAYTQAALLGLYDPGRSQSPLHFGEPAEWSAFDAEMARKAEEFDRTKGESFRLLTGPVSSPTLLRQIAAVTARWPKARWHVCHPVSDGLQRAATVQTFGRPLDLHPAFDAAETIVSFDDDFLGPGPRQTRNAGLFADRRRLRQDAKGKTRLFVIEPIPSATGSMADERLPASPVEIDRLLRAVAARVGVAGVAESELTGRQMAWADKAAAALLAAREKALVLVGRYHPSATQALGLLVNDALGSFGKTLRFTDPVITVPPGRDDSLKALVDDIQASRVSMLAIIGANPAYTGAGDLDFAGAMQKVAVRIHAGLYQDETAALSHWHVPLQHDLESWSDARSVDGAVTIVQPLVRPFYDARSAHVVLENLMGRQANDRELVQQTWRETWRENFDARWRQSLHRGLVDGTAAGFLQPPVIHRNVADADGPASGLSLCIRPDAGVWDGALSDNAWAQETPRPLTKLTWGNAILIAPKFADQLRLKTGDQAILTAGSVSVKAPVWVMPGQNEATLGITLGYGRRAEDSIALGLGCDAYALRRSDSLWHRDGVSIEPTGTGEVIATTQLHQAMDGFDFVRTVHISALAQAADHSEPPSFYPDRPQQDPSWGMSIDLDLCIGCNACVTACQAENNIPVVGKELVAEGREMHWMRIDHYYEGDVEEPKSYFQPVPCMHCEQAPCEMGCPVNAAVHSIDGLNLQVYNRCIGTRTCSSYCPYKVRRFNWFDFTKNDAESIQAMRNPDVTVRSRGVMEKCTYCVQRIAEARITAAKDGRPIRDGEVVTACQQACPTQAIVFGNVADPNSAVSRRKASARDFTLLEEVNTRPRTTYLARIEDSAEEEATG
ncbi:TAT-variant-translocated molybdopterin oxidoreductase [Mycoplana dimorpha]|nr:TAT-variant-translocated molybdopterin oxidoreductase [Mycoplana dimorpha]